jgi:hypothetical protein
MRERQFTGVRRRAAAVSLCVLLASPLALAACGGGTSDSTETSGAPAFTVPTGDIAASSGSATGQTTGSSQTSTSSSTAASTGTATSGSTGTATATTPAGTATSSGSTGTATSSSGGTATAAGTGTSTSGGANLGSAFCQQNPGAC